MSAHRGGVVGLARLLRHLAAGGMPQRCLRAGGDRALGQRVHRPPHPRQRVRPRQRVGEPPGAGRHRVHNQGRHVLRLPRPPAHRHRGRCA